MGTSIPSSSTTVWKRTPRRAVPCNLPPRSTMTTEPLTRLPAGMATRRATITSRVTRACTSSSTSARSVVTNVSICSPITESAGIRSASVPGNGGSAPATGIGGSTSAGATGGKSRTASRRTGRLPFDGAGSAGLQPSTSGTARRAVACGRRGVSAGSGAGPASGSGSGCARSGAGRAVGRSFLSATRGDVLDGSRRGGAGGGAAAVAGRAARRRPGSCRGAEAADRGDGGTTRSGGSAPAPVGSRTCSVDATAIPGSDRASPTAARGSIP